MEYAMKSFSIYLSSQLDIILFHTVSQIIFLYTYKCTEYIFKNIENIQNGIPVTAFKNFPHKFP